jgi:peptidoglycan/LPS O-acetylase OafA/YrhL
MMDFKHHRYHTLDGMRGIAAFIVMINHFLEYRGIHIFPNAFIAVDFFFVLSGFVICHAYGAKLLADMRTQVYLARRLARLLPMMTIGLIVGIPAYYCALMRGVTDYNVWDLIKAVPINLFMLPYLNEKDFSPFLSSKGVLFPTDDPLWSVSVEMFASIAFILLVKFTNRIMLMICITAAIFLGVASLIFGHLTGAGTFDPNLGWVTESIVGGYTRVAFGFTCGILIYRLGPIFSVFSRALMSLHLTNVKIALLYLGLVSFLLFPFWCSGFYSIAAIILVVPFLVLFGSCLVPTSLPLQKASEFLGWISYPLYCLHRPVSLLLTLTEQQFPLITFGRSLHIVLAITLSVVFSGALAIAFDRLKLQSKLTNFFTFA